MDRAADGEGLEAADEHAVAPDGLAVEGQVGDFSWLPSVKPEFADIPGPVDFLMDRFLNGRQRMYRVPTLLSSIVQSSLLASSQRSLLARAEADVLFSPDLRRFELLGWNFFDALVKIGHEHAREVLAAGVKEAG